MITAEEILKKLVYITQDKISNEEEFIGDVHDTIYKVTEAMIAFAEYHVTEAKKEIIKKATITMRRNRFGTNYFIDEDSVNNAYPLTNII